MKGVIWVGFRPEDLLREASERKLEVYNFDNSAYSFWLIRETKRPFENEVFFVDMSQHMGVCDVFLKKLEQQGLAGEIWFYGSALDRYPATLRSRCRVVAASKTVAKEVSEVKSDLMFFVRLCEEKRMVEFIQWSEKFKEWKKLLRAFELWWSGAVSYFSESELAKQAVFQQSLSDIEVMLRSLKDNPELLFRGIFIVALLV